MYRGQIKVAELEDWKETREQEKAEATGAFMEGKVKIVGGGN